MTTDPILIIELNQTDPKKRGSAYSEAARGEIHTILEKYHQIFGCITGETWETTVERGKSNTLWGIPAAERFIRLIWGGKRYKEFGSWKAEKKKGLRLKA